MEGTVYTISPRLIMPGGVADVPEGLTRRFWLTVRTPADARPGAYKGTVTIRPEKGGSAQVPLEFRVRAGTLDPVDIPAGPFGYTIGIPWYGDDPRAARFNAQMTDEEPAEDARVWLHGLQRPAVDRLPGVPGRQARPRFPDAPTPR